MTTNPQAQELPEPDKLLYQSQGHSQRWVVAGVAVPPNALPYFTADQMLAFRAEGIAASQAVPEPVNVLGLTWRECSMREWMTVRDALLLARQHLNRGGVNNTWITPYIELASSRSKAIPDYAIENAIAPVEVREAMSEEQITEIYKASFPGYDIRSAPPDSIQYARNIEAFHDIGTDKKGE